MSLWERLRGKNENKPPEPAEPRGVPRLRVAALTGYYWDGAQPLPHGVRDISESGMYIYTRERWYLGSLVLMRLDREDCDVGTAEHSIAVLARVVRWGEDGVGLEFVFADPEALEKKSAVLAGGAEKIEFEQFLAHLKSKQSESALQKGSEADRGKRATAQPDADPGEGGVGV